MDRDICYLKGVGSARAKAFSKLGIRTAEDLLYFFPRGYEDRSVTKNIDDCEAEETVCLSITVSSAVHETRIRKNMAVYTMTISDETGSMNAVWYNNRFVKNVFSPGAEFVLYGKIERARGKLQIVNPIYEKAGEAKYTGKIVPVYPLTGGLLQKNVQSIISEALKSIGEIPEYLPEKLREEYKIPDINFSMKNIHFPDSLESYSRARKRFVFDELLTLQLALFSQKDVISKNDGIVFKDISGGNLLKNNIPYKLTGAQKRAMTEIISDLKSGKQMNRLLQGDVGSGKTIVAAMTIFLSHRNGYQSVLMAPTEILAQQHCESLNEIFKGLGINVVLLTGGLCAADKRFAYEQISNGLADVVVGTHAIIEEKAVFFKLGLVIADEQHRFGVSQRARLCAKGVNPHMLIMSATPIPRTLALILYGDLDISVIDELPPGRKPVQTFAVGENMRRRVYAFLEKNIKEGHQGYVVCPLIEETETLDLSNATQLAATLREKFPKISIGLMHGKMKPGEKEQVMEDFSRGSIKILVSTTVIEVGVNVPNANVMIIENAERFGLSQLHQLRGRVGRGADQAYCILFAHGSGEVTKKRMETMCASNDGFYISEQDLKLRGPGDFFGTRQHGLPDMKIANLFKDGDLLKMAQDAAKKICINELLQKNDEYSALKKRVDRIIEKAEILN
ncbi:MAG: ATP-dependent DNA helicase RecG [Clostridia bacterium]|nr:ATP-dependent DNA helicase RecG [Clostridia bacterium]